MTRSLAPQAGFTLSELLIAAAITLALMASIFGLTNAAQGAFQAQPELSDMQQRLRIGVDALAKDLLMAGAGAHMGASTRPLDVAPVMPYRIGDRDADPPNGVFYRDDTITVLYVPWGSTAMTSHTYYLKSDIATHTFQLMQYDGAQSDLPLVDHVVKLEFEYFGAEPTRFEPFTLQDGPWYPDDSDENRFDADLLRIRRVRVMLRVQAALASMRGPAGILFVHGGTSTSAERYVPDREIRFDISPRNMNLDQ